MLSKFINWFKQVFKENTKTRKHKKHDTTKITKTHYDFINSEYRKWLEFNSGLPRSERIPVTALCDHINSELNMDKSYRSLSRIWSDAVTREEFPDRAPMLVTE